MTLQTWIIEPRDSLIVRDGKPFGANITHATSLDFPFPSTTTGGVRTRAGINETTGIFEVPTAKIDKERKLSELKNIEVRGSLLAEIDENGEIEQFYLPSPADALFLQDANQKEKNEAQLYRLLPLDFADAENNLKDLLPVGLNQTDKKDKPYDDLKFWNWRTLEKWLKKSYDSPSINLERFGIENLKKDSRTHVAINLDMASNDGELFSTRGLEFNYGDNNLKARKFALVVFVDDANGKKLENKGKLAPLGGERRLVTWKESKNQPSFLNCRDEIKEQIIKDESCRLMLLTSAYFSTGLPNSTADYTVKAVACNRYQTVSGWDFEFDQPKPTRRLLPAGSILFLKLNGDIEKFIEKTWFSCIGDNVEAKKDGFGLSILGTWDGNPLTEWR